MEEKNSLFLTILYFILTAIFVFLSFNLIGCCNNFKVKFIISIFTFLSSYGFIVFLTKYFHIMANTDEHPIAQKGREVLKILAGLLEFSIYILLFTFNGIALLIGLLVIKGIWHHPGVGGGEKKDIQDEIQKGGAAGAIFRIGVLLSLLLAFFVSLIIKTLGIINEDTYQFINEILKI